MPRFIDLTGQVFDRLTVIKRSAASFNGKPGWDCVCVCGTKVSVRGSDLRSRKHRSCGCLHKDTITKHGMYKSHEYNCWVSMKQRATNPHATNAHRYIGRGITLCERWHDFAAFISDMGACPDPTFTIERVDNTKGYCPENCVWASRQQQASNREVTPKFIEAMKKRQRNNLGRYC